MQIVASDIYFSELELSKELIDAYRRFMTSVAPSFIHRANIAIMFKKRYSDPYVSLVLNRWTADEFKQKERYEKENEYFTMFS